MNAHDLTAVATARWASADDPRLSEIMQAVVRHLHDFAREVRLTEPEWAAAMAWLTLAGQISGPKRGEFILASDVLGLSMLVVEMNHHEPGTTPATVLGPFHVEGSPALPHGANMADGVDGTPLYVAGVVRGVSGQPIDGAVLDVWQADAHGRYESQVDGDDVRLRAKYTSRNDGAYCVQTIAPLGYSIPMDGPVGDLISRTAISNHRPAHVHFLITAPGYEPLVTHLFPSGAAYLDSDVVFGTKSDLVVDFDRRPPGPTPDGGTSAVPWLSAHYDFVLQPTTTHDDPRSDDR
ncbi:dioxygenase [Mycobacterium sp. NPDC006124]|uniref:dioxygenase family protein n=1 Tax=Mycobacterium sp. NPDC006124 TaxID=3156729 RepID=UPI0033A98D8B